MTVTDDLEAARAALVMINPAPYNAEAPPAALVGDITPTELHYVRSNFAVPDHDGTLEIGGAVGHPTHPHPRRPARDAGPRAHRHPGVRRQRTPGDAAAADRGAVGRLRRLHRPLDRRPACTTCWRRSQPAADGVERPRPGRRPRVRTTCRRSSPRPTRTTSPSSGPCRSRQATDPASGILIAYEMNGEPLGPRPRRPVPARSCPHWYAVASVKWLEADRRPHRALHRRVPDRPLHVPVARPTARARLPDAGPRPDHRPGARLDHRRSAPTPSAGRRGPAPARSPASRSASPARATGSPHSWNRPKRPVPLAGLDASPGTRSTSADTPCAPERPTPPATCNPTSPPGTDSATATTPSRSSTSTGTEHRRDDAVWRAGASAGTTRQRRTTIRFTTT